MHHNVKDLSGQRFGRLTVISYQGINKKNRKSRWLCKCDCGNETIVAIDALKRGWSCGCISRERIAKLNFKNITGQRFGRLVVVSYQNDSKWLCKCDCGNEKIVRSRFLIRGDTKSCGCLAREISNVSKPELLLGDCIENEYQIKIDRSFPIEHKIFDIRIGNLLIESDGSYWHSLPNIIQNDCYKDELAKRYGYTLIRFTLDNEKQVKQKWSEIKQTLDKYFLKNT